MSKALIVVVVIIAILLLGVLFVFGQYVSVKNTLVSKNETVKAAWSQVDIVLQRRADLEQPLALSVAAGRHLARFDLEKDQGDGGSPLAGPLRLAQQRAQHCAAIGEPSQHVDEAAAWMQSARADPRERPPQSLAD